MKRNNHVRSIKTIFCTVLFMVLCTVTVCAGTWEPAENGGSKYKNDDGTYLISTWFCENGKWYFLDENGLLAVNTTVEGYELGADGAEISGSEAITSRYPQVIAPAEGEQSAAGKQSAAEKQAGAEKQSAAVKPPVPETTAAVTATVTYVVNKNTKKFHKPGCSSVSDMAAKNRLDSGSSRDTLVAQGYAPCKRCKP